MIKINVGANIKAAEPEEIAFAKQFNLVRLPFQRKGTAYDFECPHTGKRYELKCDHAAARTGNAYIETAYSNDGGATWVESGFSLAQKQAQVFVIKVDGHYWFFDTPRLAQFLLDNTFRVAKTAAGRNGNREGAYARGLLVPLSELRKVVTEVTSAES